MVVCNYFLEGRCRFGENCRNEHPRGGQNQGAQRQLTFGRGDGKGGGQQVRFKDSFGTSQNPYKWSAPQGGQGQPSTSVSTSELINGLPKEIQVWEASRMWPFSCISVEKDMPCLPDFHDVSPEELRLEAYMALKAGNIQPYIQKIQQLSSEFSSKKQLLHHPSSDLKQKLARFLDDARKKKESGLAMQSSSFGGSSNMFGTTSSFGSTGSFGAGSSFGAASSEPKPGLFGKGGGTSNVFGNAPGSTGAFAAPNIFGGSSGGFGSTPSSTSAFGSSSGLFGKSTGATGAFGTGPATPSVFGNTPGASGAFGNSSGTASVFGGSSGSAATFGSSSTNFGSVFGGNSQTTNPAPSGSAFGTTPSGSAFGTAPSGSAFGTAPSGSAFGTTPSGSAFGTAPSSSGPPSGFFGGAAPQGQTTPSSIVQSTVYTPLDKLTEEEKAEFLSSSFTLGKIPMKPPAKELIMGVLNS